MIFIEKFKNMVRSNLDPEIVAVRRIIRGACGAGMSTHECDDIFVQRLKKYPGALKLSFWENHFEWQAVSEYPEIHGRILDFGCGSGHSDIFLARNGYEIHGVDLSSIGIDIANHLRGQESIEVQQRLSFSLANIVTDSPKVPFDSAWASHVFEHIPDPSQILKGLQNWLRPGAYMLLSVPLGYAYDDPGHINHFADGEELKRFLGDTVTVTRLDISKEFQVIRALCRF